MPYIVTCPKCDTKLKSGQPVPAGRSLTCPQCKTNFTLKEPAQEVDASRATSSVPPPTAKSQRPVASRNDDDDRPRGRRRDEEDDDLPRARRRDEDEEDDRPRSKRRPADDEDEDEKPKSRKRLADDDDEEDRPKSRKRPADDDEEDRPKSRKRRDADEDEEDARPKSRKSRDDDDDDDERPKSRRSRDDDEDDNDDRPRSRGGKKKGSKKMLLIFGALAALFLFCAGGALVSFIFFEPLSWLGLGGGASSDLVAWVPSEMQSVEGANVEAISKNTKMMSVVRPDVKDIEAAGVKLEDMSSFVLGKRGGNGATEVYVVKTKSGIDKDKVIKALGGQKQTANGKEYYRTKDNGGLYFPSDKILVLMKNENQLSNRLAADTSKVLLADDLKAAIKKADGDLWAAGVGSSAGPFGDMSKGGLPGMAAPPPPKSVVMNAKLQSSGDVAISMEMTFNDSDAAKKGKDSIDAMFTMIKGFMNMGGGMIKGPEAAKMQEQKKMFDSVKVTQSGSSVTISMTGSPDGMEGFGKGGGMGK